MRMAGAAEELLPYGSDTDDRKRWLDARREGVTASEVSAIIGLNRWQSPMSLYFAKLGHTVDWDGDDRTMLGQALESYVLSRFAQMTHLELEYAGLLANRERPWQLATPDALVHGHIPVEAKSALGEEDWGSTGSEDIPVYYRCQLLWQMDVLGADHGYLCVIFLRSGEPRWYKIFWDGQDIAILRDAAAGFLRSVELGIPPPPDGSEATYRALRERYQPRQEVTATCNRMLRRRYIAALRRFSAAEENLGLIKNMIRYQMGFASRLADPDGATVATRRGPNDALYAAKGLTDASR